MNVIGMELCRCWGLDPTLVQSIEIVVEPDELPRATVHLFLNEGVMRELTLLRRVED